MDAPFDFPTQPRIRLDHAGRFWLGAEKVTHPGVLRMLHTGLRRLPEGGYGYVLGDRTLAIEVEDAPFTVLSIGEREGQVKLYLSDETEEVLAPRTLSYQGDVPYALLERGDRARFSPMAALALGQLLVEQDGHAVYTLGEQRFEIPGTCFEPAQPKAEENQRP